MLSTQPYLIRAIYEWILDNEFTPYLLVNAKNDYVQVPRQFVGDVAVLVEGRQVGRILAAVLCRVEADGLCQVVSLRKILRRILVFHMEKEPKSLQHLSRESKKKEST